MESLKKDHDLLIGRTVTIDDILSSINYLNDLGYGIGTILGIPHTPLLTFFFRYAYPIVYA